MSRGSTGRSERLRALETAIGNIEKQFGKGAIWMNEKKIEPVPVWPTGIPGLDAALGVGGLPRGRIVEVFGPESSGKTTLALHAIAEVQRREGVAAFIDAEHALDLTYARNLGVDPGKLLVSQPDSGEQALEIADALARSGAVDMVVIDSVAALVPRAELEGEMGQECGSLQARLMAQAMRKLCAVAARSGTTIVFTNQLRQKVGVTFGSPETTTGGNALKFYASVRLDIRRVGSVQGPSTSTDLSVRLPVVGSRVRVKVVKNKVAPPFEQAEFGLLFSGGVVP